MKARLRLSRTGSCPQTSWRSEVSWDSWDTTANLSPNSHRWHDLCMSWPQMKTQVRWRQPSGGTVSVNRPLMTWRDCTMAPILAYADFTKLFKLHIDACGTGLGAVLYQMQEDGTEAVIAYASRSFDQGQNPTTQHTSWSFSPSSGWWVGKFHEYLYDQPSICILTTTLLHMCSWQPSWMQPVTTASPAWWATISSCTIQLEK